jgi:hypothetical protein
MKKIIQIGLLVSIGWMAIQPTYAQYRNIDTDNKDRPVRFNHIRLRLSVSRKF